MIRSLVPGLRLLHGARPTRAACLLGLTVLAACDAGPTAPAAGEAPAFGVEPVPFRVFDFDAAGRIDGRWVGRLTDGRTLMVDPLSSASMGMTIHLVQTWTLTNLPDDGMPVTATLSGIVNLATGRLVLNGAMAAGTPVHVRGDVTDTGGGTISIGGEFMFNPQPEPPGHF